MSRIFVTKINQSQRLPQKAAQMARRSQRQSRRKQSLPLINRQQKIRVLKLRERNKTMIGYIRKYFISGLLVWLPILVTFFVIKFLVDILSKSLLLLPPEIQPDVVLGYHVPGVGVVLTLLVIFFTGLFTANVIGSWFLGLGDSLMGHIPLVRSVYSGVKQVT